MCSSVQLRRGDDSTNIRGSPAWRRTAGIKPTLRDILVICYQIIFGIVCVNADDFFFDFRVSNTRGHSYKLYQQFSNCTSRSKFFSERVVTLWNSLYFFLREGMITVGL